MSRTPHALKLLLFVAFIVFPNAGNSQEGSGSVTFYRPVWVYNSRSKITVFCDGKEIAAFPDRSKLTVRMQEGVHHCNDKDDPKRQVEPLVIDLKRGQERFVELRWNPPDSMFFGKGRPQLKLQQEIWRPDTNGPSWRELRVVK